VFLKRYFLSVAAALTVALAAAGGALAKGHPAKSHSPKAQAPAPGNGQVHSLIPSFAPRPSRWLQAFRHLPHDAKPRARHEEEPAPRHSPKRQPRTKHRLRATTLSIYERRAQPWILADQGCSAAHRHENGIVVLDFGKPAFRHHHYGTILFSGRFASNHQITAAMLGYARGYASCLPQDSTASIELARGTSNYHPSVPSPYLAGVRWARETNKLGGMLGRKGLADHVEAAAADDAEPAWDPSFHKTRDFFHGFRAAVHGHTLYDYGSLDGGVGVVWGPRQAWYVAGGLRNTKALPEIYNSAMAREWAELARIARGRYHRGVRFAGVMTQGTPSCNCGLRQPAAHRVLAHELDAQGVGDIPLPEGGTNIIG
jgi:hypothetical protein